MERQPRRRRRPALSCLECRRRKIKCDRNEPCNHCVSSQTQCNFDSSSSEPVPVRQQPQFGAIPSPPPSVATSAPPKQNNTPNAVFHNEIRQSIRSQDTGLPDFQDLLRRVQVLEESASSGHVHTLSETGLQDSQIILNKTRLLGWSHRMGWGGEFASIWACYTEAIGDGDGASFQDTETRAQVVRIGDLLQKCKEIARGIKMERPSRYLSCPEFSLTYPSREMADKMVNLYFGSFESTHRILHVPTFYIEYQRYWNDPEAVTVGLRLKMLLVIGIGSSLYDHGDADAGFRHMVHQWIYAAQNWLSGPLEKDRLNITGLQVHCLAILGRQIFSIGGDLVWMSMGSLVHRAMQIGLHRDPKHFPAISVMQAEVRRRLWATILELIVQSSLDSAMPPRISFDEFDTQPPANVNDNEMDESTTLLQSHPRDTYTSASIQILLLDSLPIRLRVLQRLNGLHSELSYLDVLALSAEITDAYRSCGSFMKKHGESGVTPFHRNLLYYLVRRFLIPLHCPFANKARTSPLFHYSLKVSLDASIAIISPEPDEGFSRLMALGGGLFREGFRYAMAVISVELMAQVEAQGLDGTLLRNSEHLKQAVKDMISLSAERIRQGETNIKSHMFLNMVIGQVGAMETGTSYEFKIAQSAVDSLEFCHNLLQTRASNIPTPEDTNFMSTDLYGEQEGSGMDFDLNFFMPNSGFS